MSGPHPLRGRRALVVGGCAPGPDGAPAEAVAAALAAEGAAVAVAGDTGRPGASAAVLPADAPGAVAEAVRRAARTGTPVLALHCASGSEAACRAAVAHTTLEFGGIDLVVVCAEAGGEVPAQAAYWLLSAVRGFARGGAVVLLAGPVPQGAPLGAGALADDRRVAVRRVAAAAPEELARGCVRAAAEAVRRRPAAAPAPRRAAVRSPLR
ncbi:hypothetical protein [Nocardiopsis composta]|uniref:Uncharacterized protein n=1 Tax=Nocardiopsis composta TaxID=157465 RepID=A0A7W8VFF1_9ACTN|nr:hypothetical protein [Nocardiopsis composta]MBB5434337.1 hypothetical protein [Nocardiopsis composta]